MADQPLSYGGACRSAVYSYLRPLLTGRRVLELGGGTGEGAAQLARLGAQSVTGAGEAGEIARARTSHRESGLSFTNLSQAALEAAGPFDVVLVPEALPLLQGRGPLKLEAAKGLLAPGGQLACVVANGDREGGTGMGYFDLIDRLNPHFAKVRMFGQTPFAAFGIAEFDEAAAEMRVEADPALAETDEPTHYIAVAGEDGSVALGYALVQVPPAALAPAEAKPEAKPVAPSAPATKASDAPLNELRQKLADAQGQAEGLLRVSRAQTEEIEELRARVRRTAESKAELDEEVRRLRRALIEADESVVRLTRKTTEDMTALAQRLTTGLRETEREPGPELSQELRRREATLAERESALSERDDRIATLEAARQEALWRADAAEDEASRLKAELTELRQAPPPAPGPSRDELLAALQSREQALEEFQRAAAVHLDEVARLRDALNEQSSLVVELEEDLGKAEKQLADCQQEGARLRQTVTEVEAADRERRSRLAELEGQMMRLQRTQAEAERKAQAQGEAQAANAGEVEALREQVASQQAEVEELRSQIAEAERRLADSLHLRDETERARKLIAGRLAQLEEQVRLADQAAAHLAELRVEAPDPEEVYERLATMQAQYDATVLAAARVPTLEAELAAARAQLAQLQASMQRTGQ